MSGSGTCTDIINLRYQDGSVGSPSNPSKFNNQDFGRLKESHLRRGRLFVDNTFPPDYQSLGNLSDLPRSVRSRVEWMRPADIVKAQNAKGEPSFFVESASRFDFAQGKVGNCWFLAAIASLTFQKDLMVQVVPIKQDFQDYAGIFHFRFWRFGKWVDVVIDDYLPTFQRELLSVSAKTRNEFWVPLLEKAYAKVCGSYADMNAGLPSEAFKDFSGGVHMTYKLKEVHDRNHDEELWTALSNATKCKSMICSGTAQKGDTIVNTVADTGIVDAHAYSITGVTEVFDGRSNARLVRVMNPWGEKEWNGRWSDQSYVWDQVSSEDKLKCIKRDDGEFWMELEDFCANFQMLTICCENPNFLDGDVTTQWKCMIYDGEWIAGRTAGGSLSNPTKFATNPQFRITVTEIDEEETEDKNVLLSLMQIPAQRYRNDERLRPIGLTIFELPPGTPSGRIDATFFRRNAPLKRIQMYGYDRDAIENHSLKPGEYVIIPSIMKAYESGKFVLSVYTKTDAEIEPHHEGEDDDEDDHLILPTPPKPVVPAEKATVYEMFKSYADQNGELSAWQLRKLLNETIAKGSSDKFDWSACRSMIATVDADRMGKMTFKEFSSLWSKFEDFKKIFNRSNVSKTGTLTLDELLKAVKAADIDLDEHLVWVQFSLMQGDSSVSLVDFLSLMLRIDNMTNKFKDNSTDGVITLDWNEWSHLFL